MLNSKVLLGDDIEITIGGETFSLPQPKFLHYVRYSDIEFLPEDESKEALEESEMKRIVYLYNFFGIGLKHFSNELTEKLHNLLLNYEKVEVSEQEQKEKPDFIVTDVDIVYVVSKFLEFYKGYTHKDVLEMPLNLFFDMYNKIEVIQAEIDNRIMDLYSMPAYLKTDKGVKYIDEIKKNNKEKMKKVFVTKIVDKTKENWEKLTEFFNNNEIGKPMQ